MKVGKVEVQGIVSTDTITETTSDNGVSIDSVICKDSKLGAGRTPTQLLDAYATSGDVTVCAECASMVNGNVVRLLAKGTGNSVDNYAEFGMYYNSSADTNAPTAFFRLDPSDGTPNYLWVSDADNLMISTTIGNVGTTSGTVVGDQTSDKDSKKDIQDIQYTIEDLMKLRPVEFKFKGTEETRLGFIAQETEKVVKEAVYVTGDFIEDDTCDPIDFNGNEKRGRKDKRSMRYYDLIPLTVKSIQELKEENEDLKAKYDDLLKRIEKLEK